MWWCDHVMWWCDRSSGTHWRHVRKRLAARCLSFSFSFFFCLFSFSFFLGLTGGTCAKDPPQGVFLFSFVFFLFLVFFSGTETLVLYNANPRLSLQHTCKLLWCPHIKYHVYCYVSLSIVPYICISCSAHVHATLMWDLFSHDGMCSLTIECGLLRSLIVECVLLL